MLNLGVTCAIALTGSLAFGQTEYYWTNPGGGSWHDASSWSPAEVPDGFVDSRISMPGNYTVVQNGPMVSVVYFSLSESGVSFEIPSGHVFRAAFEFRNEGTVTVNSDNGPEPANLELLGPIIEGSGEIVLAGSPQSSILGVAGQQFGQGVGHSIVGSGTVVSGVVGNQGVIDANVPGSDLVLEGDINQNRHILRASAGGRLVLAMETLRQNGGFIIADGGTVEVPANADLFIIRGSIATKVGGRFVIGEHATVGTWELTNDGVIEVMDGGVFEVSVSPFINNGELRMGSGENTSPARFLAGGGTTTGDGLIVLGETVEQVKMEGSALADAPHRIGADQTVRGSAGLSGNFEMRGDLEPGLPIGRLVHKEGTLSLHSNCTTRIELATETHDEIESEDTLELGGRLEVLLTDDLLESGTGTFRILSATNLVGSFDEVLLPEVQANRRIELLEIENEVSVRITCLPDLNADGALNFFDLSTYIQLFNAADPAADFTGDGSVNFFDLSAFLQAFNAGCP